jgi:toxin ParE1/3/4
MNGATVLKTPSPDSTLAACYAYIGERNLDAAHRFRQAAEVTFEALARTPGIGTPNEIANRRSAGLRCARVRRFRNYLIFYRPIEGGIDVSRVLHAARNIKRVLEEEE